MDRKSFLQKFSGILLVGIPTLVIASCSSDSEDPPIPGAEKDCLANGTTSSIASNHGHSLSVPKEDVDAGVEKEYNIQGTSGHGHSVIVSSGNFASLKNNQSISITSTTGNGHTHPVTVSCS
jgi:hypothetical protein